MEMAGQRQMNEPVLDGLGEGQRFSFQFPPPSLQFVICSVIFSGCRESRSDAWLKFVVPEGFGRPSPCAREREEAGFSQDPVRRVARDQIAVRQTDFRSEVRPLDVDMPRIFILEAR